MKRFYMNTPDNQMYYSENPKDFEEDILNFYKENNEPINIYELEEIINSISKLRNFKLCDSGFSVEINGKTLDFTVEEVK